MKKKKKKKKEEEEEEEEEGQERRPHSHVYTYGPPLTTVQLAPDTDGRRVVGVDGVHPAH